MWTYLIYWIIVPTLCCTIGYALRAIMTNRHRARGTVIVSKKEDGKTIYLFKIDGDPDAVIASKNEILFEVQR